MTNQIDPASPLGTNEPLVLDAPSADSFKVSSKLARFALIVGFIHLMIFIWWALNVQQRFTSIEKSLSEKLEASQVITQQSLVMAKQAEERSTQTQAKTAVIEEKLKESRDQQDVLQTLYDQLAENREATAVAEVEQLITIANQQLQLSNNVKAALLALQAADKHLEPLNLPRATQLREVLGNEIANLRKFPQVDMVQLTAQLENVASLCANLPLISERQPTLNKQLTQQDHPKSQQLNQLQSMAFSIWSDVKNLVTIERIDRPEPPLLTANHAFYLRENLKLRLLTARIALLQHDDASYQADINTIIKWLNQYYDVKHPNALKALKLLYTLANNHIGVELPQLTESLSAVSRYKQSLEKQ